jgi:glycosyltransferase involved in cell wall biosynthesis
LTNQVSDREISRPEGAAATSPSSGNALGSEAPIFSVITVCYNEEVSIVKTLSSVLDQSWAHIQVIVIDGGSCDRTMENVIPLLPRIDYIESTKDRGIYDAMNKGLNHAKGDFVCFMNAGDVFASSDVIGRLVSMMDSREICYYGRALVKGDNIEFFNPPMKNTNTSWIGNGIPSHQATFYPKAFFKTERYDLTIGSAADTDYTFRCFKSFGYSFANLHVATFHLGGVSNNFKKLKHVFSITKSRISVLRNNLEFFGARFKILYLFGPTIGWMFMSLFSHKTLSIFRKIKNS